MATAFCQRQAAWRLIAPVVTLSGIEGQARRIRPMENQPTHDQFLQIAFDLAPVGICLLRDRKIAICNESFARMFGYEPLELINQPMTPLYPSVEEFQHLGDRGLSIMKVTGTYSDDRIMQRRGGTLFWCHVVGRTVDRSQPYALSMWMFEDISERRPITCGTLTMREREIAQHLVTGATSKQIARCLNISHRTVEAHRGRLMRKLNTSTNGELIALLLGSNGNSETVALEPSDA